MDDAPRAELTRAIHALAPIRSCDTRLLVQATTELGTEVAGGGSPLLLASPIISSLVLASSAGTSARSAVAGRTFLCCWNVFDCWV
jgi:hypothetical protein